MLAISALLAVFLPWLLVPAMAVLAWRLRHRRLRAGLVAGALVLLMLTQFRELAYLFGYPSPRGEAVSAIRQLALRAEDYTVQIHALSALATAALAWPLPPGRGLRALSLATIAGLAVAAMLTLMLQGLRFN